MLEAALCQSSAPRPARRGWGAATLLARLRSITDPRATHRAFDAVARGYEVVTGQAAWRGSAAALARWLPTAPGAWALDLGAGPGASTLALLAARPDARVVALDRSPAMTRRARHAARRRANMRVVLGDAAHLPFAAGAFALVSGHSFLYLMPDRPAVLAEARRVLRLGGHAAFMEPGAGWLGPTQWARLARGGLRFLVSMVGWRVVSGWHVRFTPGGLSAALSGAGFADVGAASTLHGAGVLGWGTKGNVMRDS